MWDGGRKKGRCFLATDDLWLTLYSGTAGAATHVLLSACSSGVGYTFLWEMNKHSHQSQSLYNINSVSQKSFKRTVHEN